MGAALFKRVFGFGITGLLLVICISCAEFVSYNNLGHLHKGMWVKEVRDELPVERKGSKEFKYKGTEYTLDYFELQTSKKKSEQKYVNAQQAGFTNGGSQAPYYNDRGTLTTTTDDVILVIMLYKEFKLYYWGTLGDFAKAEDANIAELSPTVDGLFEDEVLSRQRTIKTWR